MSLFIIVALGVYTLMHLVVYWGVRPLLLGHGAIAPVTLAWMALMIMMPFAARFAERTAASGAARILAWTGYTWMGFVFIAFTLFLLLMLFHYGIKGISFLYSKEGTLSLHGPVTALAVLLAVTSVGLYGMMKAHDIKTERVVISTPSIESGKSYKIAQVSDVHLGVMNHAEVLAPIAAAITAEKPDLILATGDVVDAQINHLDGLSAIWADLKPPLGKFAILGNHEYYAGLDHSLQFLADGGFRVLRDETAAIGPFLVAGVDDRTEGRAATLLKAGGQDLFKVFMKHRPEVEPGSEGLFDLMLSGHTHGGQIYPFRYLTMRRFPYLEGFYQLQKGSILYVNRGTGTWGPPMRVGADPELTIFEIRGTGTIKERAD